MQKELESESTCDLRCPECGGRDIEYENDICLTCFPQKFRVRCKTCKAVFFTSIANFTYPPHISPPNTATKTGWICPLCGRGVSPDVHICPCNDWKSNIVYCCAGGVSNDK